jgi:hypothetical protein
VRNKLPRATSTGSLGLTVTAEPPIPDGAKQNHGVRLVRSSLEGDSEGHVAARDAQALGIPHRSQYRLEQSALMPSDVRYSPGAHSVRASLASASRASLT